MVSSRGGKFGFVFPDRFSAYNALRRKGLSKQQSASIANGGHTHVERSSMAKQAARTRKAKGGR